MTRSRPSPPHLTHVKSRRDWMAGTTDGATVRAVCDPLASTTVRAVCDPLASTIDRRESVPQASGHGIVDPLLRQWLRGIKRIALGVMHLFPSMARPDLPKVQPLVAAYCAAEGVPYTQMTLWQSYRVIIRYLNSVGLRGRDPFLCPLVTQRRAL
jgi:hypothetical protein